MNPLIALQGKQFDPMGVDAQLAQTRAQTIAGDTGAFQLQQAKETAARQAQMRNMLTQLPENATPEQVNNALLRAGNPEAAATYTKTMREAAQAQAQAGKANREAEGFTRDQAIKAMGLMSQTYQSFLKDQTATPEKLIDNLIVMAHKKEIPENAAVAEIGVLQNIKTPEQWRAHLQQRAQAGMSTLEQINAGKPTFETVDYGGVKRTLARYPDGRVEVVREDKVSVSPNTAATNATQLQTTAMQTGSREKVAGMEIAGRASEGEKNREAAANKEKALTDSQSKALLFGARAQEANKVLEDLAKSGVDRPGIIHSGVSSLPLVGGVLSNATNVTQSDSQQGVEQARRDFINAVLRRESGAVISDSEFANAERQYFPQIGDSEATKRQKRRSRELAIQGILAEVPENKRNLNGNAVQVSGNASQTKNTDDVKRKPLGSLLD